ncbi:MAG: hypothetical protein OXH65_05740 [Paracoccaceae bacterium]|nr:hypothetical protein [Paracoccaceae bacterium]MDE2674594.1 hypothetical protein [Paracoccaceae bacterium]
MNSFICLLLTEVAVTFISGVLLAITFFLVREKCFALPKIEGRWFIETRTVKSDYNPYKDMILIFEVMLWREGNLIHGTAEKVHENSASKQGNYIGKQRTRSEVSGNIEKRYFGVDKVSLHFIDKGPNRDSTTLFELTYRKSTISGKFDATAGSSNGDVHMRRKRGTYHFQPKFGNESRE